MRPTLEVVEHIAEAAERIVALRPRTLLLSGGSTPRSVYGRLAESDLPWAEIECYMGDERCVPPSDERSNFGMARAALLDRVRARAYPMDGASCDAERYERLLRERFGDARVPSFDVAIQGIGEDGHTASLFPGSPALDERERWCVRVEPPEGTDPPVSRLTLTLPVLSASKVALFLVAGESKREAVARLLAGDTSIPAARVQAERVLVIADRAAAP